MSFAVRARKRLGPLALEVDFESGPGVTALFGPSGAGKTTVLNMVAGLASPDRGRIVAAGRLLFDSEARVNLPPRERGAGYVFQDRRLFPHRRVEANLRYGAGPEPALFDEVVRLLDLAPLLDRWPRHLSGGEAQRVAIGRALLSAPRFLLLDEPLSHLDRARAEEIMRLIERARDAFRLPTLYVTHNLAEVERLRARRVDVG